MRFLALRGLRPVLKIIAFSIFAYQMMQATGKYFDPITIPSTETKDIKDSKLPNIFLCETNQTTLENFAFAGYDGDFLNYLKGSPLEYDEETITWVGDYVNSSFAELTEVLFTPVYEIEGTFDNYTTSFTIFNGFCEKLDITAERLTKFVQLYGHVEEVYIIHIDLSP